MAILVTIPAVQSVMATQQLYITRPNSNKKSNKIHCIISYNTLTQTKNSIFCCGMDKKRKRKKKKESNLCAFVPYVETRWNCSLAGVQAHTSDQALLYALTNSFSEVIPLGITVQRYQRMTCTVRSQNTVSKIHCSVPFTPHPPAIFLKNKMLTEIKINRNRSLFYSTS